MRRITIAARRTSAAFSSASHWSRLTPPNTVVLVEDIGVLRDGMAGLLREHGVNVIGSVRSGPEAVPRIVRLPPAVVLVDTVLGDGDRVALVRHIRQACPVTRVVVMGLLPGRPETIGFIRAGATGLVVHEATVDDLIQTIAVVAGGGYVLPRALTGDMFAYVAAASDVTDGAVARDGRVTQRERQVADLIARGLSNKEIAGMLHIATHTVKSHVHSLLEKLGLRRRTQIAADLGSGRRRWPRRRDLDPSIETRQRPYVDHERQPG